MKKIIIYILSIVLLLNPVSTFALPDKEIYVSTNLEETLKASGIELQNKNYKETDTQIPVYIFKSSACQYTDGFLNYLNSISEEYGEYFKLVSYEVEGNKNNMNLYMKVADFLELETRGVPFFIIGDKTQLGYNEEEKHVIAEIIKEQYNRPERYDIFEDMERQGISFDIEESGEVEEEKEETEEDQEINDDSSSNNKLTSLLALGLVVLICTVLALTLLTNKKKIKKTTKKKAVKKDVEVEEIQPEKKEEIKKTKTSKTTKTTKTTATKKKTTTKKTEKTSEKKEEPKKTVKKAK